MEPRRRHVPDNDRPWHSAHALVPGPSRSAHDRGSPSQLHLPGAGPKRALPGGGLDRRARLALGPQELELPANVLATRVARAYPLLLARLSAARLW